MSQSFEEFILKNREHLKKRYISYQDVLVEKTLFEKAKIVREIVYNQEIIIKWSNCIYECFGGVRLSQEFKDVLSIYCELISVYRRVPTDMWTSVMETSADPFRHAPFTEIHNDRNIYQEVANELKRILSILIKKGNRSKIIDTYYNYNTGKPEYLLEDGTYIPKEDGTKRELELDISVLPSEILPIIDNIEYRNKKIDEING